MRANTYQRGIWAERYAAAVLLMKGYRVVDMRFKTPLGEIDIVARRGRLLVFVEVKRRGSQEEAREAIHTRNRQRVGAAAQLYLQRHPEYNGFNMRFDAVVISPHAWPRHICGAWE